MCVIVFGNISRQYLLHAPSPFWWMGRQQQESESLGLGALGSGALGSGAGEGCRESVQVIRGFLFTLSRSSENFSGYLYIFHGVYRNNCHSKGWIIVMCKNFPEVLRLSGRAKTFRLAIPGFLSLCYFLLGKTSFPQLRTCFTATPDTKRICFFEVKLLWHISLCGHLRLYSPTLNFLQF